MFVLLLCKMIEQHIFMIVSYCKIVRQALSIVRSFTFLYLCQYLSKYEVAALRIVQTTTERVDGVTYTVTLVIHTSSD